MLMKITRKVRLIFIYTLLAVLALAAIVYAYFYFSERTEPAIRAIPKNAAIIFVSHNPQQTWEKFAQGEIWNELLSINTISSLNGEIKIFDSIAKNNNAFRNMFKKHPLYISLNILDNNHYDYLFAINLYGKKQKRFIQYLISEVSSSKSVIIPHRYKGTNIYNVIIKGYDRILYYSVYKGVLTCSFNSKLIEYSIDQLHSLSDISDQSSFKPLLNTAGKKVNANIFLNYQQLSKLLKRVSIKKYETNLNSFANFAEWSELDLLIHKDNLIFTGYTTTTKNNEFLSLFLDQPPSKSKLINYFPENTCFFCNYSLYNFSKYYRNYQQVLQKQGKLQVFKQKIKELNKLYYTDFEKNFTELVGNEMAMVISSPESTQEIEENTYVFIGSSDSISKNLSLMELSKAMSKLVGSEGETRDYLGYKIKKFNVPGLMPLFFGNLFGDFKGNYFTIVNNVMVFGNSIDGLKNYLNYYKSGKVLSNASDYRSMNENTDEKSNVFFYCNIGSSSSLIPTYLSSLHANSFINNIPTWEKFSGFTAQYTTMGNLFYTNICIKHTEASQPEYSSEWEVSLDAPLLNAPVVSETSSGKKILVFDYANTLYQIDTSGIIEWQVKLKERPFGKINITGKSASGKLLYAFNTENYFYVVDENGQMLPTFPVKMKARSSSAMIADEYTKGYYRFITGGNNKRIYAYDISGNAAREWTLPLLPDIINSIQTVKAKNKDYYILTDARGNIYTTDKHGKQNGFISKIIGKSSGSFIYANSTTQTAPFLCTDSTGNIMFMNPDGEVEKKSFGNFSSDHHFIYEDFNGDNTKDYIYFDNGKLTVYNNSGKILFESALQEDGFDSPISVYKTSAGLITGVFDVSSQQVYLIDKNGEVNTDLQLVGDSPVTIERFNKGRQINVLVGLNNKLLNYRVELKSK